MSKIVYIDDKSAAAAIIVEVGEIEEVIAPKLAMNQNETLVIDEVELDVEGLEEAVAPTPSIPIPPPFRNH